MLFDCGAHNNSIIMMMGELPVLYGAITSTVRFFFFSNYLYSVGAITSTVLTSRRPTNHTILIYKKLEWNRFNKANLRDLIAATGLVILLKLDSNRRFFSPCDLEIWWMTPQKKHRTLLCYFKLSASFRSHWWIQTGVTVWKRPI